MRPCDVKSKALIYVHEDFLPKVSHRNMQYTVSDRKSSFLVPYLIYGRNQSSLVPGKSAKRSRCALVAGETDVCGRRIVDIAPWWGIVPMVVC